jgi:hypothetical protein
MATRRKKSGAFRRRALKAARLRKAKALRVLMRTIRATRVRINRGGYDSRGKYWGVGAPLYRVESADDYGFVRAQDSKAAKERAIAIGIAGIRG